MPGLLRSPEPFDLLCVSAWDAGGNGSVDSVSSVTYRKWAQECLAMVKLVVTEHAKVSLVLMAQGWHRLAQEVEEQEHRERPPETTSPPPTLELDARSGEAQVQPRKTLQP